MRKFAFGFMVMALVVGSVSVLYACSGHEQRAANEIADIIEGAADDAPGTDVKTEQTSYNAGGNRGQQTGTKTTIEQGGKKMEIYPAGDHLLRVKTTDKDGKVKTYDFRGGEWNMVPNTGNALNDFFQPKDSEEEYYAG